MRECIISIKQIATVVAKCRGVPIVHDDGTPIWDPLDIDVDGVIELPMIVRCVGCKAFIPSGYCAEMHHKALADGYCNFGERRDL